MAIFVKDPAATIDFAIDWSAGYLGGETIATSAWAVTPDLPGGVVVIASSIGTGRTGVTLAGGVAGTVYHVTNSVRFSDSRSDERMLVVRVEAR